jgi:hypothetical protein
MNSTMNNNSDSDPIVAFYLGESTDRSGRRIEDIWTWDNRKLEQFHDYIQWLFPLCEMSQFNPGSPTLTVETIDAFRKNDELRNRLSTSLEVMLKFYGLKSVASADDIIKISRASDFNARSLEWLNQGNHNYLRITRILKSLQILGLSYLARALFACLDEIYHAHSSEIGSMTFSYWKAAANP